MNQWTPATDGRGLRVHADPEAARAVPRPAQRRQPASRHRAADTTAVHSLSPTTWLSGVRPKATQGVDAYAGVTADQIAAQAIGQDTLLPSMELATEDHSGLIGSCDRDYGCIYMNTLSWRTPTTPMPMEINPRKVFERMFGQGGSDAARLDAPPGRPQHPRRRHRASDGPAARARAARPRRRSTTTSKTCARSSAASSAPRRSQGDERRPASCPTRPAGVPFDYEEHVELMYDLMALAYQADITRVFTFMVAREVSNRTYPQVGVTEGHHAVSHHQNRAEKIEKNCRASRPTTSALFGEFLDEAATRRRTATARCSTTRCCSTAAT